MIKREAHGLRRDAQKSAIRSTISLGIGTSLGIGLITGSLLALAAAKGILPFIVLASLGAVALLVCLSASYSFGSRKADQEYAAALLDQLAEDLVG